MPIENDERWAISDVRFFLGKPKRFESRFKIRCAFDAIQPLKLGSRKRRNSWLSDVDKAIQMVYRRLRDSQYRRRSE